MIRGLPRWLHLRTVGIVVLSALALHGVVTLLNRPAVPVRAVRGACDDFLAAMQERDYRRLRGAVLAQGGGSIQIADALSAFADRFGRVIRYTYRGSRLDNSSDRGAYGSCYATYALVLDSVSDARMRFGVEFSDTSVRIWGADLSDPEGKNDYLALRFDYRGIDSSALPSGRVPGR